MGVDGWNTGTLGMGIWNEEQNINHCFQTSPASCWNQWHIAIRNMFLWNQTLFAAQSDHTRNIPLFPQWKLGRDSEWSITTKLQEKLCEKVLHLCNVTLEKIDRINWQGKIQDRKAITWGSLASFEYWNWKAQNKNKRKRKAKTENEFFSIARGWNSPASKGRKVLCCFLAFQVSWHWLGHRLDSMTPCPAVSGVLNYMVKEWLLDVHLSDCCPTEASALWVQSDFPHHLLHRG